MPRIPVRRLVATSAIALLVSTSTGLVHAAPHDHVAQPTINSRAIGIGQIGGKHAVQRGSGTLRQSLTPESGVARNARVRVAVREGGVDGLRMLAPYLTQMDGSTYAGGNCGPAALAMALGRFGHVESVPAVREWINHRTGDWSVESGTSWHSLKSAAEARGFRVKTPFGDNGHARSWTIDEVLSEAAAGHPVIVLVKYRTLPGHERASWWGDHYVTILGQTSDGRIVYHDPAFHSVAGAYRTINRDHFNDAWVRTSTGLRATAMAIVGRG
jgi:hypothetical protein